MEDSAAGLGRELGLRNDRRLGMGLRGKLGSMLGKDEDDEMEIDDDDVPMDGDDSEDEGVSDEVKALKVSSLPSCVCKVN